MTKLDKVLTIDEDINLSELGRRVTDAGEVDYIYLKPSAVTLTLLFTPTYNVIPSDTEGPSYRGIPILTWRPL